MERVFLFLAVWFLTLGTAFAAPGEVEVTLRAFQVVSAAGASTLVPTTRAKPGDTIEYQVTYTNRGATPARDVKAILPIPKGGMTYLAGSALPAKVLASLDGVNYAPAPLQREVVRDGRRVVEPVPLVEYRTLRWDLGDLPAAKSATVTSRMRLEGAPRQP